MLSSKNSGEVVSGEIESHCFETGWALVCLWEVVGDYLCIIFFPFSFLHLLNCPYLTPWASLLFLLISSPPTCWVTELLPNSSCATSVIFNVPSAKRGLPGDNTTPCSIFVFMQSMKFVRSIIYPEASVTELNTPF